CAVGMGVKETVVTAPVVLLAYDRIFLSKDWKDLWRCRGLMHVAVCGTWGILAGIMLSQWHLYPQGGVVVVDQMSPWKYASAQPGVILHYLRLSVWPAGQCLDYAWEAPTTWAGIVGPSLVIGGLVL